MESPAPSLSLQDVSLLLSRLSIICIHLSTLSLAFSPPHPPLRTLLPIALSTLSLFVSFVNYLYTFKHYSLLRTLLSSLCCPLPSASSLCFVSFVYYLYTFRHFVSCILSSARCCPLPSASSLCFVSFVYYLYTFRHLVSCILSSTPTPPSSALCCRLPSAPSPPPLPPPPPPSQFHIDSSTPATKGRFSDRHPSNYKAPELYKKQRKETGKDQQSGLRNARGCSDINIPFSSIIVIVSNNDMPT